MHFQPFQTHEMKVNRKWKVETSIFTNGKGYEFTRDPQFVPISKKKTLKKKMVKGENEK
jgi:hypothetical protein